MNPWADLPRNRHTGLPMTPRRWQTEALPAIGTALREGHSPVVVAGTGSGKAVMLSALVRAMHRRFPAALMVVSAPTVALVEQLREDLGDFIGARNVGAYYTGAKDLETPVIVTCNPSIPALVDALSIVGRSPMLWVADEAHKTAVERIEAAIAQAAPKYLVGFTATPYRSTEAESLRLFSTVCYRYTMADATRDGVLVPYDVVWPREADGEMPVDDACIAMLRRTEGPAVVGASTIEDAIAFAARLTAEGIPAEAISAATPKAQRRDALDRLRRGDLRAVVHVALLIEGVDLPWLRVLCLRRPLTSPVALVQQIGRVLRAFPGKTRATVLDPHGLLRNRSLTRPDAIGDLESAAEREVNGTTEPRKPGEASKPEERWAVLVSDAEQAARNLLLTLAASGVIRPTVSGAGWRSEPATARQVASLDRMHRAWTRHLPEHAQEVIRALWALHEVQPLDRGTVSDLLSILAAVAEQAPPGDWQMRRGWGGPTWPDDIDWPRLPEGVADELRRARDRARRQAKKESAA